ncbi:hypothetical protein EVAR_19728_1 [Eumeta japonica]|uniref:Uncharacterized protein n=1 Tax=Eumeta variegata TaxID=151549 RepID=A0A4C1URP4_EUMVA|nr:hypothetical protein EVAR_19728_1 [Eumeta japonica]
MVRYRARADEAFESGGSHARDGGRLRLSCARRRAERAPAHARRGPGPPSCINNGGLSIRRSIAVKVIRAFTAPSSVERAVTGIGNCLYIGGQSTILVTKKQLVTVAHGHSQLQRSRQCVVGFLNRSRLSDTGGSELLEREVGKIDLLIDPPAEVPSRLRVISATTPTVIGGIFNISSGRSGVPCIAFKAHLKDRLSDCDRVYLHERFTCRLESRQVTNITPLIIGHTFDSNPVPTLIFDPSPVLNFGPGSTFDSDSGPILDSVLYPAFNSDSDTNHSSDLN